MPEIRVARENVCDFCSDPWPVRTFEAEDNFLMDKSPGLPELRSRGGWMACITCLDMIEGDRWHDLLDRAVTAMVKKHSIPRYQQQLVRQEVKRAHDLFRSHRKVKA